MKKLNAAGKGEHTYDVDNDILIFKIKDRDYQRSIEFDNLVLDIDTEEFVTGFRIFDVSKTLNLSKNSLKDIEGFEFSAKVEDNVVNIQLRFSTETRNKLIIKHGQDFVREVASLKDSEAVCTYNEV